MYMHRSGYRPPEPYAIHQRRRYRLMPGQNPNPNAPSPDPSLWIVHYSQADAAQHIPSARIPVTSHVQSTMTARRFLQQHGQLVRKEFMLHDRNNWPTINLPGNTLGAQASAYPNNVISHLSRQQPAYVQPRASASNQATIGAPPAKRVRQNPPNASEGGAASGQPSENYEPTIYDEEDVSRGDALDFLTPRDISTMRYKQHHDWLGEVFRSPWDTRQIVPGELGLGRKGELEALTRDFFNAPTEVSSRSSTRAPPARVGRMEPGKADEFTRIATDRITEINAEIERMKRQHARRMAKLTKGSELQDAERNLRAMNINTANARPNEGIDLSELRDDNSKIADIQAKVEATLGKKIRPIKDTECIQKGGLQEKVGDSEDNSQDYDFGDQAADLSGQIPAFQTPQDHLSSTEHSPGLAVESGATSIEVAGAAKDDLAAESTDVAMSGMQDAPQARDGEPEDWVVVNKEGDDTKDAPDEELPDLDAFVNDPAMDSNAGTPGDTLEATGGGLADFSAASEGEMGNDFVANDFTEGVDFGNLDTAGEALSGYEAEGNTGMDDDADLGLDDSAFGDAFHGTVTGTGDNGGAGS